MLNPDILDVDFSRIWEKDGHEILIGQTVFSKNDYCVVIHDYKYVINIDGNAASWGRGTFALLSDAVPIFVDSNYTEMYMA